MTIGHLCYATYSYDESPDPVTFLRRHDSIRQWCQAVKQSGVSKVTVVQRFRSDDQFEMEGVRFKFIKDGNGIHPSAWHIPSRFHKCIRDLNSDVVHVNGGVMHLRNLRTTVGPNQPIVWQHHSGLPPTLWKRKLYGYWLKSVDGVLFSSNGIADSWINSGIIRPQQPAFEVMEGSSAFMMSPRAKAQKMTGMRGRPVFLWVGRLDANKDPLTILDGFARIRPSLPDPQLFMVFQEGGLLDRVKSAIRKLDIGSSVHLLGNIAHSRMALYYSSADYFLLGSHREGSGYALIEALSCGVHPIVTDIPSFRTLTRGKLGDLWTPGDPLSFSKAALNVVARKKSRGSVRAFFERTWSYQSIGKSAHAAYLSILDNSVSKKTRS